MDRSLHEVRTNPRRSGSWLRDAVVFGFRELKGKVGVGVGVGGGVENNPFKYLQRCYQGSAIVARER